MTWALFSLPTGRLEIDLRVLVPADARLISDHQTLPEARDAREAYQRRQEREVMEAAGQQDLFNPPLPGADQRSGKNTTGRRGRR